MINPTDRQRLQEIQEELKSVERLYETSKKVFLQAIAEVYAQPRVTYRDLIQATGLSQSKIQRAIDRYFVEPVKETWETDLASLTPEQREAELLRIAMGDRNLQ